MLKLIFSHTLHIVYHNHDTPMQNGHRMFIYIHIEHIGISKHKKHLRLLSSGTKLFLLPLSLKVLWHKERDTHSFYSGFIISPPRPGFGEQVKANCLLPRQVSTQLTDFFKSPKILHALPMHDVIHIHWSTFLWDFYFDIYERNILPAHALTPALKFAPN